MTSFVNVWNATYLTLPPDTEVINLGASRIRDFKSDFTSRIQVDHEWLGTADDGGHNKLTMIPQVADPTYSTGGDITAGFFYTKTVNTHTELFYKDESGNVVQLTSNGGDGVTGDLYQSLAATRAGCVQCDGSSYPTTGIYAPLYALLGATYNHSGDAAGTFRVPDFRGYVLVGAGTGSTILYGTVASVTIGTPGQLTYANHGLNTGQAVTYTSAGPIGGLTTATVYYVIVVDANTIELATSVANALAGTGIAFTTQGTADWVLTYALTTRVLGSKYGEEAHILSIAEQPIHKHTLTDPGHHHVEYGGGGGGGLTLATGTGTPAATTINTGQAATGITMANSGSNTPHNTAQPSAVVNIFIHL